MALSEFQLLLNNLSNELNERNLQSLIHICGELIPGGQRDSIRTGWQVFTILLHQNAIGEDPKRLRFLLRIFKELRPKRRDMVCMITRHIQNNCEQPETILGDLESSGEINFPSRPPTPVVMDDCYSGCLLRCGCLNCTCTRCCDCCCCCVIFAILFLFLAAASAIVWYTPIFLEVQKFRKNCRHCHFVGPLVILVFVFVAVSCALCAGYLLCLRRRRRELNYSSLLSSADHMSTSNQAVYDDGSCAASVSTRTSSRTFPRRMECSHSSGRVTASSSYASLGSYRPTALSLGITSDGCSKQKVFNIDDDDEDQESKRDNGSTEDTLSCYSIGQNSVINMEGS